MAKIGLYMIVLGLGSIVLNWIGWDFKILSWMGDGYGIRLGIAGVGLILAIIGLAGGEEEEKAEEKPAE